MIKRLLIGIAVASTLAATAALGSASVAHAECLDVGDKEPNYCYLSRSEANVWVTFVNNSDRLVGIGSLAGRDLKNDQQWRIAPSRKVWIVGKASSGEDILAGVGWCPTTSQCGTWIQADTEFKNPTIGYPWAKVNGTLVRFSEGETNTFTVPFERGGKKGVAYFTVTRVKDYGSAKHFKVYFTIQPG